MTPKANIVRLRLTEVEREAWARAAGGKGKLSSWVRQTCNTAALVSPGGGEAVVAQTPIRAAEAADPLPGGTSAAKKSKTTRAAVKRTEVSPTDCPRWMHHRTGTYCGSCKQVI